ncbi:unnamed protein product, partial [Cercopithifilaria johnstoni]
MHILLLITLFTLLKYSIAIQYKIRLPFCNRAPNSALQIVCSQLKKWDTAARQHHSTSLNESSSSWNSQTIWSINRSRWTNNFQSWTSWSSWSLPYSMPSQEVQYLTTHTGDKSPLIMSHHVNLPIPAELKSNFKAEMYGPNEPKRMAFEIEYEISSLPKQARPIRTQTGQMINAMTSSPCATSSLSLSPTFNPPQQMLKNKDFIRDKSGVQGPFSPSTIKKDLYTMEQDTVGPPGQQQPNNLFRKQFSSSPSSSSPVQPSSIRISDRSNDSPVIPTVAQSSKQFKRNQANVIKSPPRILMNDQRMKALACMDLICLCPFLNGSLRNLECFLSNGKKLSLAIRKEYRQLSTEERERFHNALNQLKRSGDYDKIAQWHSDPELSGGAHSGPAFLPWHREYIKRLEIALRIIDPDVSLPYWDSTLENAIPESTDTILFSKELMGENDKNGNIINGFISHWTTSQ